MKKILPKLKEAVIEACKRHAWNIGVSEYRIDIYWKMKDKELNTPDGDIYASMSVNRRYRQCALSLYPIFVKEWAKDGQALVDRVISHEIAHLATDHMFWVATACYKDEGETHDAWETLTEIIGRMSAKINEFNNIKL